MSRSWMAHAACKAIEPADWFDDDADDLDAPIEVCEPCVVRDECLEYAVTNDIRHGIWGGVTPRQRVRMAGRRARVAAFLVECEAAG